MSDMIDQVTQLQSDFVIITELTQKLGDVIYNVTQKLSDMVDHVTLKLGHMIYHVTLKLGHMIVEMWGRRSRETAPPLRVFLAPF